MVCEVGLRPSGKDRKATAPRIGFRRVRDRHKHLPLSGQGLGGEGVNPATETICPALPAGAVSRVNLFDHATSFPGAPGGIKYGKNQNHAGRSRSQRGASQPRNPSGSGRGFTPAPQTDSLHPCPAVCSGPVLAGGVPCAGLSRGMYGLSVLQRPLVLVHETPPIKNANQTPVLRCKNFTR